ncbi:MAG TPA: hypothetical protein VK705_09740 [Ferruginibacter sp.]|jgi:hypothetical protein|nr:hypothetical protein [Ferruginibacter sp.]
MTLLEINFTTYIPATLLGLLGLISGYLYFYFKNRDDNKLKQIQSADSAEKLRAIEMSLNELGVSFDTSNLDSTQKFILIQQLLRAKTKKYLITSITAILLSGIVAFLIYDQNHSSPGTPSKPDTIQGDKVNGDKIEGDKVQGDKVEGDKKVINK